MQLLNQILALHSFNWTVTELIHQWIFNHVCKNLDPLRAEFLRDNINIYLHFMSFLHTNKTQVVDIPPRVRQAPAYST